MSKFTALTLGILLTIGAVGLAIDNMNPCMWPFVLAAVLLLGVGIYKYQRDYQLVAQARQAQQAHQTAATDLAADDLTSEMVAHMAAGDIALGYNPETGKVLYLSSIDRYSGTYIIGVQGSGKSAFIQGLIAQEVAGGE